MLRQCCQHSRHWHSRHWCCSVENTHDTSIASWFRQRLRDYNYWLVAIPSTFFQKSSFLPKFEKSSIFAKFWKIINFCQILKNHHFLTKFEKIIIFGKNLKNHHFLPKFEKIINSWLFILYLEEMYVKIFIIYMQLQCHFSVVNTTRHSQHWCCECRSVVSVFFWTLY